MALSRTSALLACSHHARKGALPVSGPPKHFFRLMSLPLNIVWLSRPCDHRQLRSSAVIKPIQQAGGCCPLFGRFMHYNHATDGKEISYQCVAHNARYGLLPSQAPALATRRHVLLLRVQRQERRLSVPSMTSAVSPGCIQLCQQSDADGWALPALHGIQQQKQHQKPPPRRCRGCKMLTNKMHQLQNQRDYC